MKKLCAILCLLPALLYGQTTSINMTNIAPATGASGSDYVLGVTNNHSALIPLDLIIATGTNLAATVGTNIAAYQALLSTNTLNTALVSKISGATNTVGSDLRQERTDSTNQLNTAIAAKLTAATNTLGVALRQERVDSTNQMLAAQNNFTGSNYFGGGLGSSSATVTTAVLGNVIGNGSGLTNGSGFYFADTNQVSLVKWAATNSMANGVNVDFSTTETTTNLAGNAGFSTISNFNPTNYNWQIVHTLNTSGADRTTTFAASWHVPSGSCVTTNNGATDILVSAQIGFFTNATWIMLK